MRSLLAIFGIGILGLIVQSALAGLLPGHWVPDLGLLIPVVAILALPPIEGLLLAAVLGVSAGMFSNALLGQYALLRILEFVVIRVLNAQLDLKRPFPLAVFAFAITIFDAAGVVGITWLFFGVSPLPLSEVAHLLVRAGVNGVVAPLLVAPLCGLVERFAELEAHRRRDVRLDTKRPVL
jgi:cell shape-determining protein MreD